MEAPGTETSNDIAHVAVVGLGWWSQGWHLPHLHRNPNSKLVGICDKAQHPKSNLNPDLESLQSLSSKYGVPAYTSLKDLLENTVRLDGIVVATPHATHSDLGEEIYKNGRRIHILMEKPMTTNLKQAQKLHELATTNDTVFLVNHSANYIRQTVAARSSVEKLGALRHIQVSFASALSWIFEDPSNTGWNEPTADMLGNGFGWGQSSHVLAWLFHVCPQLEPRSVHCRMTHSPVTGADVAHSGTIVCRDARHGTDVIVSISGTSLLPGNEHSDPPVGKRVVFKLYGNDGALIYMGDTRDAATGDMELRQQSNGGAIELPTGAGFSFENLDQDGTGPESLQNFILACLDKNYYAGADSLIGLRTVQVLDAMYRSHSMGIEVQID